MIGKGRSLRGYTLSDVVKNPLALAAAKQYVYDRLAAGRFNPKVAKAFPLAQAVDAYRNLESNRHAGRVLINVS